MSMAIPTDESLIRVWSSIAVAKEDVDNKLRRPIPLSGTQADLWYSAIDFMFAITGGGPSAAGADRQIATTTTAVYSDATSLVAAARGEYIRFTDGGTITVLGTSRLVQAGDRVRATADTSANQVANWEFVRHTPPNVSGGGDEVHWVNTLPPVGGLTEGHEYIVAEGQPGAFMRFEVVAGPAYAYRGQIEKPFLTSMPDQPTQDAIAVILLANGGSPYFFYLRNADGAFQPGWWNINSAGVLSGPEVNGPGGGSGGLNDGNYGAITVSGGGTVMAVNADAVGSAAIQNDAVTLAKMAHGVAGMFIGYDQTGAPASLNIQGEGVDLFDEATGSTITFEPTASTDAARGAALVAALAAFTPNSGDRISVRPGVYNVTTTQALPEGVTIFAQGSTIYHDEDGTDVFTATSAGNTRCIVGGRWQKRGNGHGYIIRQQSGGAAEPELCLNIEAVEVLAGDPTITAQGNFGTAGGIRLEQGHLTGIALTASSVGGEILFYDGGFSGTFEPNSSFNFIIPNVSLSVLGNGFGNSGQAPVGSVIMGTIRMADGATGTALSLFECNMLDVKVGSIEVRSEANWPVIMRTGARLELGKIRWGGAFTNRNNLFAFFWLQGGGCHLKVDHVDSLGATGTTAPWLDVGAGEGNTIEVNTRIGFIWSTLDSNPQQLNTKAQWQAWKGNGVNSLIEPVPDVLTAPAVGTFPEWKQYRLVDQVVTANNGLYHFNPESNANEPLDLSGGNTVVNSNFFKGNVEPPLGSRAEGLTLYHAQGNASFDENGLYRWLEIAGTLSWLKEQQL